MPCSESQFSARDGLCLYEQCWLPEGDVRAAVIAVHGLSEHSGRLARMAEALNRQGYAVHAMDLRGHGRSQGPRCLIRSFDEYLDDLDLLAQRVESCHSGGPRVLLGHSMGGLIAAAWTITRQPAIDGLVLSGPLLRIPDAIYSWLRPLAAPVGRLIPRLRAVRVDFSSISRDPQVTARFLSDPLVFHGRFPVRTAAEILRAIRLVSKGAAAVRVPLLILHGTDDRLCDPEGSRELCRLAGSSDKTLHLYEGLYHDLVHDPEGGRVLADLVAWIESRTAGRSCPPSSRA